MGRKAFISMRFGTLFSLQCQFIFSLLRDLCQRDGELSDVPRQCLGKSQSLHQLNHLPSVLISAGTWNGGDINHRGIVPHLSAYVCTHSRHIAEQCRHELKSGSLTSYRLFDIAVG